jgi:hypothetical protein
MVATASPAQAANLAVTSNADSGAGTLRAAVNTANNNGVADNITFNLPEGSRTITLTSGQITFTDTAKTTIEGGTAGVTVSGNNASRVFYVDEGANLSLENLKVSGGKAFDHGGGIRNDAGTLSVTDSTISGNAADFDGGGIYNQRGTLRVTDSTISGNSANRNGGGIYNFTDSAFGPATQSTTIENSTISGNTAQGRGGGVYNNVGLTTISNSTITNNTAPAGLGAGVASCAYAGPGASTVVGSSIVAANSSTDVDFFSCNLGTVTNSFSSDGYNLVGDGNATGAFNKTGDQIIANNSPGLGALADNGGPTETHALLAGSPALGTIPQGTNGCGTTLTQDQRGVSRPQGLACDTGSFEQDTKKPWVSTATPTGTSIERGTNIAATFSEKMSPTSITKSTFKLYKVTSSGTTQVTNVTVTLSSDSLTATLNPFGSSTTQLAARTKYKVVVTTGAKDIAGNALDQNSTTAGNQQKSWTFTTKG